MNTCIELTTAVYMYRVCNFAGFKPKCKTDFLPWLHHSKFFMQTQYNFRGKSQVFKEINCYSNYDWIDQKNQTTFYLLTALRLQTLSFCYVVLEMVKWSIWGYYGMAAKKTVIFLFCLTQHLTNLFWLSMCTEMVRKSHIREPGWYWILLRLFLTTSQPCCPNRL